MIKTVADIFNKAKERKVDLKELEQDLNIFQENINLEKEKWEVQKAKLQNEISKLKEDKLIYINDSLSIRMSEISSLKKYSESYLIIMKDGKRTYSSKILKGLLPVDKETFDKLKELIKEQL